MSHQDALPPTLTPQETAAAARAAAEAATAAAAEAATAAAAEAATAAAAAATGAVSAPENEAPAAIDKPDDAVAAERIVSNAAPLTTEPEDPTSRHAQQAVSLPEEKKPDVPVDAPMVATSAPMTDPAVLNQMNQANRPPAISPAAALSSVSPGPTTSIQPQPLQPAQLQPVQPQTATHVPNLPSVVSPIQKKASNLTPFICDVIGCGKAFGKKFNLKAHRRVHTGDEPFVCSFPTCGKRFKWKSSLTFHEGLHLNAPEEPHPQATAAELAAAAAAAAAPTQAQTTTAIDPTATKKPGKV